MNDFDLFMEIPVGLKITERQRKAIDNLNLSNRRSVIKALMSQQGIGSGARGVKAIYDVGEGIGEFVGTMHGEYDNVAKMKLLDDNKHQYVSCRAGQFGRAGQVAILSGGMVKELKDFSKKGIDKKQRNAYGGISGILRDGIKDMKNNIIGSEYGVHHREEGACNILLKKKR